MFGIGDPLSMNNVQGFAMGDVKYALNRPFYLNYANPASYATLKATTFSVGVLLNRTFSSTENFTQENDNGSLRYFNLGIPITKKLGMAIGARPFTSVGYEIKINSALTYPSALETNYQGQGGLNIIYGGLGYKLISDTVHTLTIGGNANFFFGNERQAALNKLDPTTGALNSIIVSKSLTNDFAFDLGAQYSIKFHKLFNSDSFIEHTLNLGATYSFESNLKTRFEDFSGSFVYSGANIFIRDTLDFQVDTSSIFLPSKYGFGFSYQVFNRHNSNLWIISAEYETQKWSELTVNNQTTDLANSQQYAFGIQFVPKADGIRNLFGMMRYRVGITMKDSRIVINEQQIKDFSASAGFGIPLVRSRSIYSDASTVDFGIVLGSRGTIDSGLIREQYTNIYIGLSFSPNYWDRWFKKRKIN